MFNKKCLMKWSIHWSNYLCNHSFDFSAISVYIRQLKGYWIDMKRPPPPHKKTHKKRNSICFAYTTKPTLHISHCSSKKNICGGTILHIRNAITLWVKNLPSTALAYRHWLHYSLLFKVPRCIRHHRKFGKISDICVLKILLYQIWYILFDNEYQTHSG